MSLIASDSRSDLKVVLAQLNLLVGAIEKNTEQVVAAIRRARDEMQADVIVFSELTLTSYPPEDLLLREGLYRRIEASLKLVCGESRGIVTVIGYPHNQCGTLYNVAAVIRDGEIESLYRKQCLPNYGVFDEKRYFDEGEHPVVFEVNGVSVGVSVCEDAWSPGPIGQSVAAGAQMIVNLNASPYHVKKGRQREEVIGQRVMENRVPVVYVNQVGGQDELVFDGESFVMSADGAVSMRAPAFDEGLYVAGFSTTDGRVQPLPGECVEPMPYLESVYQALVHGVRDYVNKNGFNGAVLGLSGGIDSALTLAIAVDALGADRVEAVSMPSRYTADMSMSDAEQEAQTLGVAFSEIPIEPVFRTFLDTLSGRFAGMEPDTTEENIQARCRGIILMAISNKTGRMVLTTGNKSEMAVGYATLYGDMAGGFSVLKDVPKTLVFELSNYRNSLSPVIPQRVIDRPPSAELAPDQKDEDSLPPYDVLDPIIELFVEQDLCVDDIVAEGFDEAVVRRVISMIIRNEYKRRQSAPGVKVSEKAFGRDRRYPITTGFFR